MWNISFKFEKIKNSTLSNFKENANFPSSYSSDKAEYNTLDLILVSKKGSWLSYKVVFKRWGSVGNIFTETSIATNTLPHGADTNVVIMVKLKRKRRFRFNVCFKTVFPVLLYQPLLYLNLKIVLLHDSKSNVPKC